MQKIVLLILTLILFSPKTYSQNKVWVDVTDSYIKNPRFDNNDYSNWSGTAFGGYNPKENAEHYNKTYDTYQQLTGLKPGHYRLSLQAFYRMGSAANDYSLYKSGNYSSKQHAKLYYTTSAKTANTAIKPASSGAVASSFGGAAKGVGTATTNWWGGTDYSLYIPDNMEAAYFWFQEGYYNNSIELDVPADGKLKIGVSKTERISEDWTCLDNWKLEMQVEAGEAKAGSLIINELMAANVDVYRDPSTNFGSWVELYNTTSSPIILDGLYVSNDANNLKKHKLLDGYGVIPAQGFAVLNFDHHEVWTQKSYRQIDDKLDCDGGTIIISDGTSIIAQVDYPAAISRVSYARTTDGGDTWGTTGNPSPGKSNVTAGGFATARLEEPAVDTDGMLFKQAFTINVTIPEGCTLRYTTDGTAPTLTNGSTSSTGKFSISTSISYRFRLFKEGMLPSPVATRTYIKDEGKYCFPIISVVADNNDLFASDNGIFSYSANGRPGNGKTNNYNANMDWDRPVNFEYITEDGKCVINQECDYSACGGWSRGWEPHSFKLKASKAYEAKNSFDYQFFSEKPFLKHKTLQIRNGGNDNTCRIKDAAVQGIVASSGLYIDHQAWQPVHVFYNGKHYAVLNMREPNNKHYGYANYGIDTDLMDQFEINPDSGYVQKEGTEESFLRLYELSKNAADAANYDEICKLVDIDEYINYMAVELYVGSNDWPHNNVKGFRSTEDGKFHFVLFDVDFALNTSNTFNTFAQEQTFTNYSDVLHGYDWSQGKSIEGLRATFELKFVKIFLNLLNNDSFRKQFIDAFCLVSGSVFEPTRVKEVVNDMSSYLSRFGWVNPINSANDVKNGFTSSRQTTMINNLKSYSKMKLSGVSSVTAKLSSNIESAKILVNGQEVPTGKFSGRLFAPVTVKATAPAGYKFAGWKNTSNTIVANDVEYTLPASGSTSLIAVWEKMNDSEITSSGQNVHDVVINEVSASNSMYVNDYIKKDDWVELYNTTDNDIDLDGYYLSDNESKPTKYKITSTGGSASTTIPAHGYLIVWASKRDDMGKDIHASFKLGNADGSVIMLTSADKKWSDVMKYDIHDGMESVGRFPDASGDIYKFTVPTIGKANSLTLASTYAYSEFTTPTAILSPVTDEKEEGSNTLSNKSYNLNGQEVNSNYRGIIIKKGKKVIINKR